MDPTQSTVTGIISNTNVVLGTTLTIVITAKDSGGVDWTSGGDEIVLLYSNHWTRGSNMACSTVATSTQVLASRVTQAMTDHSNGTYSTTLTLSYLGNFTASLIVKKSKQITGKYYNSGSISGSPDVTNSSRYSSIPNLIVYFNTFGLLGLSLLR